MKRTLWTFGLAAVVAGVLAYPLRSHAFWIGNTYATCMPDKVNQAGAPDAYYYQSGGNTSGYALSLTCHIEETSDRTKATYKNVYIHAKDYSAASSVRAMACLFSETGSGGGCTRQFSTTGSTGAIETINIPATELRRFWTSGSGYAALSVTLPPSVSGKPDSSIIGYFYSDL